VKAEERISFIVDELKKLRIKRGLSVRSLAKLCGLSHGGIRHMENGDVTPTLFFLITISDALEADLPELLKKSSSLL